jgi:photosystem II stability/assembly factor-like uncharacterized protein
LKEWLYAVAFAYALRGYAVGANGIILRTDDGGVKWKDQESGISTNLFAVSAATRDDAMAAGDHGLVLATKDGGENWISQPTITSTPLFAVAYRGGTDTWVAGRGGTILRRNTSLATFKLPGSKLKPILRGGPPKMKTEEATQSTVPDDDIPKAVRPEKKPQKP